MPGPCAVGVSALHGFFFFPFVFLVGIDAKVSIDRDRIVEKLKEDGVLGGGHVCVGLTSGPV